MIIFHFKLWKKENIFKYIKKDFLSRIAKYAGIALIIFLIFYTPVIISDVYKKDKIPRILLKRLAQNLQINRLRIKLRKVPRKIWNIIASLLLPSVMEAACKKNIQRLQSRPLFTGGNYFGNTQVTPKTLTTAKRDFLVLLIVWIGVFTILTIPVSFQLRPRFFIVVFCYSVYLSRTFIWNIWKKNEQKQCYIACTSAERRIIAGTRMAHMLGLRAGNFTKESNNSKKDAYLESQGWCHAWTAAGSYRLDVCSS